MPKRLGRFHFVPPWSRGLNTRRLLPLVRVLNLIFLLLLPMQMRAGADDPHPHALLQLILDARDGAVDHHASEDHEERHDDHAPGSGSHEPVDDVYVPDIASFGGLTSAGGSMALLFAIVAFYSIPTPERARIWPLLSLPGGWLPDLDPPPPRISRA